MSFLFFSDDFGKAADHYAVIHSKILDSMWQMISFRTTTLTKTLACPGDKNKTEIMDVDLSRFSNTGEEDSITLNMSTAVKFMKIPLNSTVIQPAPCFLLR